MTKKIPLRQCLGCREHRPKRELLRIVRSPDGTVFPDYSGKANGRGAYVCRNADCIRKAAKSRALERALEAGLPPELMDGLIAELEHGNDGQQ